MSDEQQASDQPNPKLIIDEDWKQQVEREREQLRKQQEAKQQGAKQQAGVQQAGAQQAGAQQASAADDAQTEEAAAADDAATAEPPPASFEMLVSTLASQAMAAMGLMQLEKDKPPKPQPQLARHLIDTLAVLDKKTKGNLTADESKLLDNILHELRMLFVNIPKA